MSSGRSPFQPTSRSIPWFCFTVRREKPSSALLCCRIQPRPKTRTTKKGCRTSYKLLRIVPNALFVTVDVLVFPIHYRLTICLTSLWLQDPHPWLVPRGFPAPFYVVLYQAVKCHRIRSSTDITHNPSWRYSPAADKSIEGNPLFLLSI